MDVTKRLQCIHKCAGDCDGYTSNTEESTFVDSILSEMPDLKQKELQALAELN